MYQILQLESLTGYLSFESSVNSHIPDFSKCVIVGHSKKSKRQKIKLLNIYLVLSKMKMIRINFVPVAFREEQRYIL